MAKATVGAVACGVQKTARVGGLLVAAVLAATGCSGGGGGGSDDGGATDRIRASEWVRDTTDIEAYSVAVTEEGERIDLDLFAAGGDTLGTLIITRLAAAGANQPAGSFQAVLERQGSPVLTMTTHGIAEPEGFETRIALRKDDGDSVQMRARHRFRACYPAEVATRPGPACTSPIPLDDPDYSLPTCGAIQPGLEEGGVASALQTLRYLKPLTDPTTASGHAGQVWEAGQLSSTSLTVLDARGLVDKDELGQWLADTGADALIGTAAERLLSAAYKDLAWRRAAQKKFGESTVASQLYKQTVPSPGSANRAGGTASLEFYRPYFGAPAAMCGTASLEAAGQAALCFGNDWFDANPFSGLAGLWGDPHLTSHDGTAFDFQGAGEYVAAKATSGEVFEAQVRLEPLQNSGVCRNVTYVTGLAMQMGTRRIGVYPGDPLTIKIDGQTLSTPSAIAAALPAGAGFERTSGGELAFIWPGGKERVYVSSSATVLSVNVSVGRDRLGAIEGLLGYYSGSPADDFRTADGTTLSASPDFDTLYDSFGDSWRITQGESLFDYEPGEDTDSFTVAGLPTAPVSLADLDPDARANAEAACSDIEGQPESDWCVVDVACSGQPALALIYDDLPATYRRTTDALTLTDDLQRRSANDAQLSVASDTTYDPGASCLLPRPWPTYIIAEQKGHTLAQAAMIDAEQAGAYAGDDASAGGSVAAGTEVDVYLIHMPDGPAGDAGVGSAFFAGQILGVAVKPATLDAGDPVFDAGLDYPTGNTDRGLSAADTYRISTDQHELQIDLSAGDGIDQIRVFVAAS